LGPGPVFVYEWITGARRWQVYALRALFVLALLVNLTVVWLAEVADRAFMTIQDQAEVGLVFFIAIAGTQLSLVMLAAPAATAGSICLDRSRGSLAHLLVTDLSSAEIVLGKLCARLLPTLGLVACGLPVMALGGLLGGIDPGALLSLFLVSTACAVGGCTVALFFSIFAVTMHEALIATYIVGLTWVGVLPCWEGLNRLWGRGWFAYGPPRWVRLSNPFWLVFGPHASPGSVVLEDVWRFVWGSLLISAALAALAVWRIRPASAAGRAALATDAGGRLARLRARLPGPSLEANPVLWHAWRRRQPSRWLRLIGWMYVLGALAVSLLAIAATWAPGSRGSGQVAALFNGLQVAAGLLLISVAPASVLGEERARGSLDVLLVTPLSTREIVAGFWWGCYRPVLALVILPVLVAAAISTGAMAPLHVLAVAALVLAYGAALTSLGLALAAWLPRPGQAAAMSVVVFTLMTVGWLFVVAVLVRDGVSGPGLAMGSPAGGVALASLSKNGRPGFPGALLFALFWIGVYSVAAIVLARSSVATLDRLRGPYPRGFGPKTSARGRPAATVVQQVPVSPR